MEKDYSGLEKRLLVVLAIASIIIVSGFAYLYLDGRKPAVEGNLIGVINVDGAIVTVEGTSLITAAINRAISNSSIKAVIIKIDSPGGFAHLVEQIYLDVLELKQQKPVVASVVTALSGGYYIAVAADQIYTHPSSMVGNVGVLGVAPESHIPSESNVETGPYKVTGFSKLLFPFNISNVLESFAGAVEESRGARLTLSPSTLRRGMIYIGTEAVEVGLADELGSLQKAIQHAAAEAGIETYTVVDIVSEGEAAGVSTRYQNGTGTPWRELTLATLNSLNPPPAFYYIYLPSTAYSLGNQSAVSTADLNGEMPLATKKGSVVVDLSHGNRVSTEAFHLLSAELAMRGVVTGYGETWDQVESSLESAACLIVAAPTEPYTADEFQAIKEFVSDGRVLLMFYDPAAEFNDAQAPVWPINSLANRWGLTFSRGYIYNEEDHYGLYRNVYVREFENTTVTRGLESLVLFTATHLHSTDSDAAWTSADSWSSVSERQGRYATISVIEKENGTAAAFGDITFLTEPYAYLEDNYDLIMNLVYRITEIEVPVVEPEPEPEYNVTEPDIPVGTVKVYKETVDGEERDVLWTRSSENQTWVERPDSTTTYHFDEEGGLLSWESDGTVQVYDGPVPDLPYPLTESLGWTYRVGYNLTFDDNHWRGTLEHHGQVVGFEYVETWNNETYWCAKISIMETDEIDRIADVLTVDSMELIWVSQEVGTVKAESDLTYYIDGAIVLEESRSLIMVSIDKGEG